MRNTDYTIESVDNALRLIVLLQAGESVQLSEAARELGVARSTAHRLLGTLVRRGFAVQDEQRRYLPGPAISTAQLVSAAPNLRQLRTLGHWHVRALSRATGETAHLMLREGARVRFVDSVEGPQALRIGSRVGITMPAHVTSGGKALLAELDREDLARLYRNEPDPPELEPLLRRLSSVRQRGYGTNIGESERGVTAIGVRVRAGDAFSVAALTLSAPSIRLSRAAIPEVAETVIKTAQQLEQDLSEPGS